MNIVDTTIFMLGCAVLLVLLTRRFAFPDPSVLVLGGLVVALVPGFPRLAIEPSSALSIFLPAVLFQEAGRLSWGELRRGAFSIGVVGPILVIGSCAAVTGLAVLLFPGIPFAVAVVMGAVVAPADSMASRAVLARLKVPRRIIAVLVGEGLVNDAVAVVIYKVAVAAVLGSFATVAGVASAFTLLTLGGALFGAGVGWVAARLLRASSDAMIYCAANLILAFLTYVTAEALGLSGALATVAAGLTANLNQDRIPAEYRLNCAVMWQIVTFALSALGFLLVGAQIPSVLANLGYYSPTQLAGYGVAMCVTILVVRMLILLLVTGAEAVTERSAAKRRLSWRENVVIGWSGMRGLVTLAAALGLPLTPQGAVFPYRDLTLFFAFATILSTLFLQGVTLSPIVRALKIKEETSDSRRRLAELEAAEAALLAVERWAENQGAGGEALDFIRSEYLARIAHLSPPGAEPAAEDQRRGLGEMRKVAVGAERQKLLSLAKSQVIDEDTLEGLLATLDVSEAAATVRWN